MLAFLSFRCSRCAAQCSLTQPAPRRVPDQLSWPPAARSRDEMAIAVALSNSNLIRMLGVLEQPLGLVMELVQGRPLAEKPNFEVGGGRGRGQGRHWRHGMG